MIGRSPTGTSRPIRPTTSILRTGSQYVPRIRRVTHSKTSRFRRRRSVARRMPDSPSGIRRRELGRSETFFGRENLWGGVRRDRVRLGAAVTAVAAGVDLAGVPEMAPVEVGPQGIEEDQFRVGGLPEQEVRQALLTG